MLERNIGVVPKEPRFVGGRRRLFKRQLIILRISFDKVRPCLGRPCSRCFDGSRGVVNRYFPLTLMVLFDVTCHQRQPHLRNTDTDINMVFFFNSPMCMMRKIRSVMGETGLRELNRPSRGWRCIITYHNLDYFEYLVG